MNNVIPISAKYIQETEIVFDVNKLKKEVTELYSVYQRDQINLRKPSNLDDMLGITYGSGSLYSKETGKTIDNDNNWNTYITIFEGFYLLQCVKDIEQYAWHQFKCKIGRARLMRMKPKTCLTYHKDDSAVRLHIPIITHE